MTSRIRCLKVVSGLALGMAIGAVCNVLGIPSPAPPALPGALLVVAMTAGYLLADRFMAAREASQREMCGGPDGATRNAGR